MFSWLIWIYLYSPTWIVSVATVWRSHPFEWFPHNPPIWVSHAHYYHRLYTILGDVILHLLLFGLTQVHIFEMRVPHIFHENNLVSQWSYCIDFRHSDILLYHKSLTSSISFWVSLLNFIQQCKITHHI